MAFELKEATVRAAELLDQDASQFYGDAAHLSPGTGVIYGNVAFPAFDVTVPSFKIQRGPVIILSHECDVAQENNKVHNSDVLFAPLATFESFFDSVADLDDANRKSWVSHLVLGHISQLFYLPPWEQHANGSVVHLNRLGHTHITQIVNEEVQKLKALSTQAHMKLMERLSHHLLRSKTEALPF